MLALRNTATGFIYTRSESGWCDLPSFHALNEPINLFSSMATFLFCGTGPIHARLSPTHRPVLAPRGVSIRRIHSTDWCAQASRATSEQLCASRQVHPARPCLHRMSSGMYVANELHCRTCCAIHVLRRASCSPSVACSTTTSRRSSAQVRAIICATTCLNLVRPTVSPQVYYCRVPRGCHRCH